MCEADTYFLSIPRNRTWRRWRVGMVYMHANIVFAVHPYHPYPSIDHINMYFVLLSPLIISDHGRLGETLQASSGQAQTSLSIPFGLDICNLTYLYFLAYTSKRRHSLIFSYVGIEDVATLRVEMHCSYGVASWFVLTVLQQWFNVISGLWFIRMLEGKDIINVFGPYINLDDLSNDNGWFLHPLLHGLCGVPLPWRKEENHYCHLLCNF